MRYSTTIAPYAKLLFSKITPLSDILVNQFYLVNRVILKKQFSSIAIDKASEKDLTIKKCLYI